MAVQKNSVPFMTEYLKHAVAFEKNVYIWTHAMNEVNGRMDRLYAARARLEKQKADAEKRIGMLNHSIDALEKSNVDHAKKYRIMARISVTIIVIALLLLLGIGCCYGLVLYTYQGTTFEIPTILAILTPAITTAVCVAIYSLPVFTGIFIFSKIKAKRCAGDRVKLSRIAALEKQKASEQARLDKAENDWIVNALEEPLINRKQDEIHAQLQIAKDNLKQIYSLNVLHEDFRNLKAVATLFEYLDTGRCNMIEGHGGIYDTYRTEMVQIAQLEEQIKTNAILTRIEHHQRRICQELSQANQTLAGIKSHLSEIEKTNAEIAHNTAISAAADQQTADAAQWMKWKAWVNGY